MGSRVWKLMAYASLLAPLGLWSQTEPCLPVIAAPGTHRSNAPRDLWARMASGIVVEAKGVMVRSGSKVVEAYAERRPCPPTAGDKFNLFLHDARSPLNFVSSGLDAALSQATGGRRGYGQGWDAYGKRYGASLADSETSAFLQTFFLPYVFHEDPRYFRAVEGGIPHRFGYAVSRVLVGRSDEGKPKFNFPEVLGSLAASAVSNAYYPDRSRTAGRTVGGAFLNIASDAGWNLLKEFGPDVWRKLRRKKKEAALPGALLLENSRTGE